jgi:predicted kinase
LPESAYDEASNRAMAEELVAGAKEAARDGYAAIADTTFLDPALRAETEAAARAAGASFLGVWLHAGLPVLEARVAGRRGDASDATVEVLRKAASADTGPIDWVRVDASDLERAQRAIEAALGQASG